jgi:type I restriction enzyme R subunit
MTSPELENLAKIGKLKGEPPNDEENASLLRSAEERLDDAERGDLSYSSRFDLAYNAAHALALVALRRAGYRSGQSLPCLSGAAAPPTPTQREPVPTTGGGHKLEPELDRLSNILETFNEQFGNISWSDADRVHKLITEDIPNRVAADKAYRNARQNSDKQNARIEHDKALARVMTAVHKDDTELFKQFMDNESFRRWLTDTVFGLTYDAAAAGA